MHKILAVELLKIRRSLALLMMFLVPLFVVLVNLLVFNKKTHIADITARHWQFLWMGSTAMWCYFMLPLYIALVTGLLNGQEHKNQTWRMMLTLPISPVLLFAVKGVLAWLFVSGATLVLAGAVALAIGVLGLLGANLQGAFDYAIWSMVGKGILACLPVLVIQHAVSWRFQNLVLPLALGVIATMGITQVGSSEHWIYYPWTYPLMALNGSDVARQHQALMLAAVVGVGLLAASAWYLGRRETSS
jgi:hypothetical protein